MQEGITQEIRLSDVVTVGPQPVGDEIEQLAHRGFKTVVNLSRKGELDQLKPELAELECAEHGLEYVHLPVSINALKPDVVDEFVNELKEADLPAYVHCRIGQRSAPFALMFHALRRGLDPQRVLQKGRKLGLVVWQAPYITDFLVHYLESRTRPLEAAA